MPARAGFLIGLALATAASGRHGVAQTTTRVSVDSSGAQLTDGSSNHARISADGRYVAFMSYATNLIPGDANNNEDVFVKDTSTGLVRMASPTPAGTQFRGSLGHPSLSADGRCTAFSYFSLPYTFEVYHHDTSTGVTSLVSVGTAGDPKNDYAWATAISGNGRFVAFLSTAAEVAPAGAAPYAHCYVRDVVAGTTIRACGDSEGNAGDGDCSASRIAISEDATRVVFESTSTDLVPGDTNGEADVFLRDLRSGTTTLVSRGLPHGFEAHEVAISADGKRVAFTSDYAFDPADGNGIDDVYVRDLATGTIRRASVSSIGTGANGPSRWASLSGDGRRVAFETKATNLFDGDFNQAKDVVVHDMATGFTTVASVNSGNDLGNAQSLAPWISADGAFVAYTSHATNLVPGDTNGLWDVFRHDTTCAGAITTYCAPKTNSLGCVPAIGSSGVPSLGGPDDFRVTATNVRNGELGILYWNTAPARVPVAGGTRCVDLPMVSLTSQGAGGSTGVDDCTGSYDFHFAQSYFLQHGLGAGSTVYAQIWSRDPGFAPPNIVGLTDGLRFTICR